jgi:hypothetical protein
MYGRAHATQARRLGYDECCDALVSNWCKVEPIRLPHSSLLCACFGVSRTINSVKKDYRENFEGNRLVLLTGTLPTVIQH